MTCSELVGMQSVSPGSMIYSQKLGFDYVFYPTKFNQSSCETSHGINFMIVNLWPWKWVKVNYLQY